MSINGINEQHISDEALSERLDTRLDRAALSHVDAHLAGCADCAGRAASLAATKNALHALADYGPIPDFTLDPHGPIALPQHASRKRVQEYSFVGWLAVRVVSTAVTFVGIVLIATAIFSLPLMRFGPSANSAALQPIGHTSSPTCVTSACGAVKTPDQTLPDTPRPTVAPVATQAPSSTPPVDAAQPPDPLIALGIGSVLAVGGMIGMVKARPRRR